MSPDEGSHLAPFPIVPWHDGTATFVPGGADPDERPWAVVVFVTDGERFVLARVPRGWCTPSGHVDPNEAPEEAAIREVWEEIGATVRRLRRIGDFVTRRPDGATARAAVYHAILGALGPIPADSESAGAALFGIAEIPGAYWRWDPLMDRMFEYALQCARRLSTSLR
ncbi:MAG: NUDIX hydrolase [Armatimonadetes bacterium]|nr:NUDIX hydrolase [Armatimonadota bacterium]